MIKLTSKSYPNVLRNAGGVRMFVCLTPFLGILNRLEKCLFRNTTDLISHRLVKMLMLNGTDLGLNHNDAHKIE